MDVNSINDVKDFEETLVRCYLAFTIANDQRAMDIIQLSQDEQTSILRVLATILWLGNVEFVDADDGNAAIADTGVTDFVAYLMEVEPALVQKALLTRVMETQRGGRRGSVYDVPQNVAQATSIRDALSKALYVFTNATTADTQVQQLVRVDCQSSQRVHEA